MFGILSVAEVVPRGRSTRPGTGQSGGRELLLLKEIRHLVPLHETNQNSASSGEAAPHTNSTTARLAVSKSTTIRSTFGWTYVPPIGVAGHSSLVVPQETP
ncbi:MAG: hypothetical protein AVDCRST_MAG26-4594 [uncultured Chloroflexia bacterium]|uniref:Uncharacterized protein n=1 Tax=uncultured Chloroflexia bacterium TaxID=1672391 RepID=A0A6J4K7C1_9CHLR|nr:MAG: hypothetical protein AVDCRST_MAG26-4594 [uncultured Chloroflexia bacterium]